MPRVIGLICCLVALAASILAKADPLSAITRGLLAFVAGSFLTQIWYVFFATQVSKPSHQSDEDERAA